MAGLNTGTPIVQVYHEKSRILPDVARVLACLYEKDINFKRHTSSYKSLLKLQASTHAPVPFYDGLTFLEESREICRYVAEKYEGQGYPFLLGKDALERASVEEWLHIEEHAFNPPSRALFCYLAFPADRYDNGDDTDMHIRKLEEVLDIYEQRLSNSEFLVGNKFTLADLVHLPNSHYIKASKKYLKLYDSRKNVRRWWDAISIRASWQHVLMDMKSVEEQNKQVELKEEHQQQKDHPRTPDYPLQMSSRIHTTRKPQTVLIDIPHEALISSSQSTPTDHRVSVAQSKETPSQEKPPQKSPIHVQSTIAPATFPPTFEKPPIVGAARLSTKDDSSKDVQQHPSQDSEQEKVTRRPYTDQRRDVSSPLSQQTGGSAFGPDRLSHAEKKIAPSDQGLGQSAEQTAPRVTGEQGAQKTRGVPNSEDAHGDLHSTTSTKPPRKSFSLHGAEPTSSPQAPPLDVDHESLHTGTAHDDAPENVQSMKPPASPDAQHGITPRSTEDDVTLAEHKFVPSGRDSVHYKQLSMSPVQSVRI